MIRNMSGLDFKVETNFETFEDVIQVPSGADVQIHYKRNRREDVINHKLDSIRVIFEDHYRPIERISLMET
jgi:hypothetical protein